MGYRLGELERRVGTLEQSISDLKETVARLDSNVKEAVARIETSMKGVATKHVVAFWIMGAVVVNFVGLASHLSDQVVGQRLAWTNRRRQRRGGSRLLLRHGSVHPPLGAPPRRRKPVL